MKPVRKEIEEDQLWVGMDTGHKRIALGIIYVIPVGGHCTKEDLIERMQVINIRTLEMQKQGFNVILLGDFNAKMKITDQQIKGENEAGECLIDLTVMTGLEIVNMEPELRGVPTWVPEGGRADQTPSTLDYILKSPSINTIQCYIDEGRDFKMESDHVPMLWNFGTRGEIYAETKPLKGWNDFSEGDWETYAIWVEHNLNKVNQDRERVSEIITYSDIKKVIWEAGNEIIGKKEPKLNKIKVEPGPLRKARQNLAQARRRVLQQLKAPDNPKKNQRIDFFRGKVWAARQIVRDLERTEELHKTQKFLDSIQRQSDKNMKKLYSFMNRHRKPVREKFGLKNKDGLLVTDEQDIKKELHAQWEKIYDSGHWPPNTGTGPTTSLRLKKEDRDDMGKEITEWELDRAISQLHMGTSAGTTDIPPELIKHTNDASRKIMIKWVRSVWVTEELPEENDKSRSIFLHKKGSTSTLDNYRTITTGCNICKVFNRILTNRLQEGMENSDILGEIQNGFRKGRRATDSLLVLETLIRKTKREKKKNFLALLDITKAYDRVNRDILWDIMGQMGVHTKLLNNIKSSYNNPSATLHFQDITSDVLMLKLGLKQGCVMSPI
ncbi:MAG: hypothetical protein GY931_11310, partial [Maribacter sp.]|nr:hypothetical protein [Maribacter sp.]